MRWARPPPAIRAVAERTFNGASPIRRRGSGRRFLGLARPVRLDALFPCPNAWAVFPGVSKSTRFEVLIRSVRDRQGLARLLIALGFQPADDCVPRGAWPAYGLGDAPDLRAVVVAGRSGALDALLLETAVDTDSRGAARLARKVQARNPARLHLFVVANPGYRVLVFGTYGAGNAFRHITLERERVRPTDVEALEEMAPGGGEVGLELALRQARALDRSRVTGSFFQDFRAKRQAVAEAWTGIPAAASRERAQLALLFLSRLTFLYFIQRQGVLAGDDRYLLNLLRAWSGAAGPAPGPQAPSRTMPAPATFYRARLRPLFFCALNRRPEDRDAAARELGALPYLNGGLFEPHALERRFAGLDLPDRETRSCFEDLLERYRFTSREEGDGAGYGVDPEVLGRVFEGLMSGDQRTRTGSFYTPAPVVQRIVREAAVAYVADTVGQAHAEAVIDGRVKGVPQPVRSRVRQKLERVRVLDPACGSGAFLLGALHRLTRVVTSLGAGAEEDVRREFVARSLHGVDLLDDAALLCSLRLWLALSDPAEQIRPLPNLDRRIRQGDALIDPLDLGAGSGETVSWQPLRDVELRRALRALEPAARGYVDSQPEERERARERVLRAELRLARRWVQGLESATQRVLRELRARAAEQDLFGERPQAARQAQRAIPRVRDRLRELDSIAERLEQRGGLPFFSFGVHFADAGRGFDFIVSNPPWIRSSRWPDRLRAVAERFEVCRSPAWSGGIRLSGAPAASGAQVDASLLFVERSLQLLAPEGVLAVLIPAKSFRALYAGAARRMLLRDLDFELIEDHALGSRSIFRAAAFAGVLVGRRQGGAVSGQGTRTGRDSPVRIRMTRPGVSALEFRVRQSDLPLVPQDSSSPWLIAPPAVRSALRTMQGAGPPLGEHPGHRVRRGVMTGANDVLIFTSVESKLGGLARVEAEGAGRARGRGDTAREAGKFRAIVETEAFRPLVRGADIDAFRYRIRSHVAWCHDGKGQPANAPRRMARYLERHRSRLEARAGYRRALPLGAVFRLAPETLGPKVVWHDLSDTLRAVALPAKVMVAGRQRELVPLNTVYFLPTTDHQMAMALAGLLNSLPLRTMARSVAERAKDSRFRFFAWTVSLLPIPRHWPNHRAGAEIKAVASGAHEANGITPADQTRLDRAVARLYGLDDADLEALAAFDEWLRGGSP